MATRHRVLTPRRTLLTVSAALAALVPACGDADDDLTSPLPPEEGGPTIALDEVAVEIVGVDEGFAPDELTVAVESEVSWTNVDDATHTVSADGGQWDSGEVAPGDTFTHRPIEPGRYEYFCTIHPSMTGTLVVE